jgi:hypothetical protein
MGHDRGSVVLKAPWYRPEGRGFRLVACSVKSQNLGNSVYKAAVCKHFSEPTGVVTAVAVVAILLTCRYCAAQTHGGGSPGAH